ncbi:MAG TPA: FtsW/RodA/SpoVE family cell cycle protein, partial [Candidatus Saccharimonadales bacterium]|nr:FtsW/RodA/SpoVE family cell cycle protein [Candidatus Saccharimonadales bacterium]
DSIFAIIAEEIGLIGAAAMIILFVIFAMRGLKIAKSAPDTFGKLVAVGVTSWVVFQALMNIAAISGIVPLTGVTLPFISYGGTSLVFLMIGVGILLNISKKCDKL